MNLSKIEKREVVVFKPKDGQVEFKIVLDGNNDTVWASEQQISQIFNRDRTVIGRHIKNIFKEGELEKNQYVQILH